MTVLRLAENFNHASRVPQ